MAKMPSWYESISEAVRLRERLVSEDVVKEEQRLYRHYRKQKYSSWEAWKRAYQEARLFRAKRERELGLPSMRRLRTKAMFGR